MRAAPRELASGLAFMAFGALFAGIALTYDLGTALRMGPGFFPLLLGGALILLGAAIVVEGLLRAEAEAVGEIPWRAIFLIAASVLIFGLTVRRLGLAPATFAATLLAAFSSRRTGWIAAFVMAAGLTAVCLVIFVELLGLPAPMIGPWLRF